MTSKPRPSLGILALEYGGSPIEFPPDPRPGSLFNPATFDFPLILETAAGAWADRVISGDPLLESAYVAAARRLVDRGAIAIVGDCGFTIRYQAAIAAAVDVPVAMSSLLLVPMLLRQLPPKGKLAILTADSTNCSEDLFGVDDPAQRARVVIGGVEGGVMWQNATKRPYKNTSVPEIEADVATCVTRLRNAHPDIAAILFECTGFPMVTPAIRRLTGLPIYDTATVFRMTFESVDNG
ncbi:hypothetical protein [Mesorhizobium sp. ORM16]|uniref:hypothetical protein n=1 Tax=Mesorhizobium sp. ORM16 TaxID=3376989 RepID=UPI003857BA96